MNLRKASSYAATAVLIISGMALAGWFLQIPALTTFGVGDRGMSVATAVCFLSAATAVLSLNTEARPFHNLGTLPRVLGLIIAAICFLALTTYLPAGMADLVPADMRGGYLLGPSVGRLAPATALSFMLFTFVLLMPYPSCGRINSAILALGMLASTLALTGYAYDVEALSRSLPLTAMSMPTAMAFIALFWALGLARPQYGWLSYVVAPGTGGKAARRLLPAIVLIPFFLGWFMVDRVRNGTLEGSLGFAVLSVSVIFPLGLIAAILSRWLTSTEDTLRRATATLVESERMARSIVDTSLDAFVQMDEVGHITEWNPQAEATFGWPREAALGKTLADLIVPPSHREGHRRGLTRYLQTGEAQVLGKRLELPALRRDGGEIKVELTVTATQFAGGIRFNGFIRDLTEKIAVEAQLRQTQKMEAIGNLTGGLAHDFNNLLAVIIGNIDMLRDKLEGDPESAKLADSALIAADRGADLTRRLLAYARQQPLAPQLVRVNDLVGGTIALLRRVLGETIVISLELSPDVWPLIIDPAQLEAALTNLATNARDAMPRGGTLKIATANLHLDRDYAAQQADLPSGDFVMIEISDSGTGMSGETIKHIYEPFFTTKERDKGSGLGLSMVFGFVKQSGGHIAVYSEEGVGSTFRLYLPRATPDATVAAPQPELPSVASVGGKETILVVEDNPDLRKVVRNQLVELGYKVWEAENAKAALAFLETASVDLLFTDVVMPGGMSGPEMAHEALKRWPTMCVLLTSGFPDTKIEDFSEFAHSWRLLTKPYRKADLATTIRAALNGG